MKNVSLRSWVFLAALCIGIVCVLAYSMSTPRPAPGATVEAAESPAGVRASGLPLQTPLQTYEGIITDTRCGAKHSATVGMSAADCTRACVHGGESFALVDGETTYRLKGSQAALKRAAGERVKVVGRLDGNTISVASVVTAAL
ncbi:MAG: hypothetical protein WBV55_07680 [Candidatus Sulfotelmatobacter sp.]